MPAATATSKNRSPQTWPPYRTPEKTVSVTRRPLRALLTSAANIIPEPAKGILRIQLLGLGSDARDRMLAPLIEELTATGTIYRGTELRAWPDFPELTTFGAHRAEALAHAVGAFAEANRVGIHAPMDVRAPTPTVIVRMSQR